MFGLKRIKELENEVACLRALLEKECKSRNSLERILRNADFKYGAPTFMQSVRCVCSAPFAYHDEYWIYLYIDKVEIEIHLKEFDDELFMFSIHRHLSLEVNGDLAYLTYNDPDSKYNRRFIIDYFKGTYVTELVRKEESEVKECTDC